MQLTILNTDLVPVDIFDSFESLIWTERYFGVGDFEIHTPFEPRLMSSLQVGYYLQSSTFSTTMIIETRQISTDANEGDYITVTGRSLESILDRRIAWGPTVLSGNFQTEVNRLFNENLINPTDPDRKIDNFIFGQSIDPLITGLTVDAAVQGMSLYEIVEIYCSSRDIGFRVYLYDGLLEFRLYSGLDRSYAQEINPYVVFSPTFDNLWNSNYLESISNYKNINLVLGDTTSKVIDIAQATGIHRREISIDVGTDDLAQMEESGFETLTQHEMLQSFEGQADTDQMFKYDDDFFMGDIVQLSTEHGIESRSRIIEMIFSQSLSGIQLRPTFVTVEE